MAAILETLAELGRPVEPTPSRLEPSALPLSAVPDRPNQAHLDRLLDAAEASAAERSTGGPAAWAHALPPPYVYALDVLAEAGGRFTYTDAAEALDAARVLLTLPDAPLYDRTGWPDTADAGAFLRTLLAEELARSDGFGGYVLDADRHPF